MAEHTCAVEPGCVRCIELAEEKNTEDIPVYLSMLLFYAREQIDMWSDVIESRTGRRDVLAESVRNDIDTFRAAQGWSPHGYGGEAAKPLVMPRRDSDVS